MIHVLNGIHMTEVLAHQVKVGGMSPGWSPECQTTHASTPPIPLHQVNGMLEFAYRLGMLHAIVAQPKQYY